MSATSNSDSSSDCHLLASAILSFSVRHTVQPRQNEPGTLLSVFPYLRNAMAIALEERHDMTRQATRIMYVECKATNDHRGRASIRRVRYSKSGRSIRIGGMILQSCRGAGIYGNYVNPETEIEYWISGPKKNGQDRHWVGGGPVYVEPDVQDEYWREIRGCEPPADPSWT
jgi:hypothetical protein